MPIFCHQCRTTWKISTILSFFLEKIKGASYEDLTLNFKAQEGRTVNDSSEVRWQYLMLFFSPEANFFLFLFDGPILWPPPERFQNPPSVFYSHCWQPTPSGNPSFNTNLNALYCHLGLNIFLPSSGFSKNSRQLVTMFHIINLLGGCMAKGVGLHQNHLESSFLAPPPEYLFHKSVVQTEHLHL